MSLPADTIPSTSLSPLWNSQSHNNTLDFNLPPRCDSSSKRKRKLLCIRNDDPKQMTLDAGQKEFGVQRCKKCGMVYDIDSMKDRKAHEEFHNRLADTRWFRVKFKQIDEWKRDLCYAYVEGGYIFSLNSTSKCSLRKRFEKIVLECVNIELGYSEDLASVWDRRGSREGLLFISDSHCEYPFIAGILLIDHVKKAYRLNDLRSKDELKSSRNEAITQEVHGTIMGINRIWVHSQMRRKSIASRLIRRGRELFLGDGILPDNMVAFSEPTNDGIALANSRSKQILVYDIDSVV
ncbi:unnamed protein product [Anisakis simplex]|uniref:Zf-C2H2_3 domain-containing protein n=1 Tax=Anisakis simplex TaxID=6269 RepID=A0A0M3JYM1_ANISI|nr:unnamed protein product [Anisakis simplex]